MYSKCVCVQCVHPLTVLSHELVELVQCLCVFRRWVVWWVLLWTGPALLGVRRRRLTAVAAHERWQDGWIVHAPVQPPEQCPHAMGDDGWVAAAATSAVISICASSPDGKRLHLQLLPSSNSPLSVHVFGGSHADGVLAPVAEATVLVLMVLQKVMNGPQP